MAAWKRPFPKQAQSEGYRDLKLLYKRYVRSAKKRNYFFDLSLDDFHALTKKPCHYCEKPPAKRLGVYLYSGLDRINNAAGYTRENVVPACWECNQLKGKTLDGKEMMVVAAALRKHRKQQPR